MLVSRKWLATLVGFFPVKFEIVGDHAAKGLEPFSHYRVDIFWRHLNQICSLAGKFDLVAFFQAHFRGKFRGNPNGEAVAPFGDAHGLSSLSMPLS